MQPPEAIVDDPVVRPDAQSLHIDQRVFPYLGIDEMLKGESEQPLQDARLRQSLVLMDRRAEAFVGRAPDNPGRLSHMILEAGVR